MKWTPHLNSSELIQLDWLSSVNLRWNLFNCSSNCNKKIWIVPAFLPGRWFRHLCVLFWSWKHRWPRRRSTVSRPVCISWPDRPPWPSGAVSPDSKSQLYLQSNSNRLDSEDSTGSVWDAHWVPMSRKSFSSLGCRACTSEWPLMTSA